MKNCCFPLLEFLCIRIYAHKYKCSKLKSKKFKILFVLTYLQYLFTVCIKRSFSNNKFQICNGKEWAQVIALNNIDWVFIILGVIEKNPVLFIQVFGRSSKWCENVIFCCIILCIKPSDPTIWMCGKAFRYCCQHFRSFLFDNKTSFVFGLTLTWSVYEYSPPQCLTISATSSGTGWTWGVVKIR